MSAFEAYKEYIALKNHFTKPNYDYIKYNGHSRLKQSSFNTRKDKLFFEKLSKRPDYHDFLIANFAHDSKLWIKELAYSEEADKRYTDWKKKTQSLTYHVKNQLNKLSEKFDSNFKCRGNNHPKLLKLYLGGEISLETLCVLLELTGAIKHWDSKLEYDPIWEEFRMKIVKYTPFLKYDREKMKKIVVDFFG
jgi:hypothetical protein